MQRGRGDFFGFGDPFAEFGGFGGFGSHRSLVSSFFGGRDPFDEPFFASPFQSMFESSMMGPNMFGSSSRFFGDSDMHPAGFLEHQAPQSSKPKGPIIKEITSEDEAEEEQGGANAKEKTENPRKHSRSKEPYVEDPDDETQERKSKQIQYWNDYNRADRAHPQARSYSFQSSTVTYGGANGAYYTSSTTRRTGSGGVTVEENKEADTTTGRATHRVSRGLHDKGHSITRKLNSDGRVGTMQTLHNMNEDELARFEEAWKGNARKHLPGWDERFNLNGNMGAGSSGQDSQAKKGGWALPSTEQRQIPERMGWGGVRQGGSKGRSKETTRINID
ncbi:PREDICTED: uncharacterized protein LOC104611327 [Nelumbo nucifera]|uniref:Uncharacterized protein LOC104611327 n=1 Tax=Nelumbo nucifera TaxID=4432 RepID=A0A1U8BI20_NELNU|nr:PREDICTED: uncharacterized protein LOC104611327 [Nelumbo nucifera]